MRAAYDAPTVRSAEAPLLESLPDWYVDAAGSVRPCPPVRRVVGAVYGSRVVVLAARAATAVTRCSPVRDLARRGARVDALLLTDSVHEAALAAFRGAGGRVAAAGGDCGRGRAGAADLVMDGMVGIGATGALREPMARLATLLDTRRGSGDRRSRRRAKRGRCLDR